MLEFLIILIIAGLVAAAVMFVYRKIRTREPAREILADWAVSFVAWARSRVLEVLARRDRDIIGGPSRAARLRDDWVRWRDRPRGPGPLGTGTQDPDAPARAAKSAARPSRPAPTRPVRQAPPPPARPQPARTPSRPAPAAAGGPGGAPVPPLWLALIEAVASFEPEDWEEHMDFFAGNAAGIAGLAEAFRLNADTQLNVIGLDPVAVHASLDMADAVGECAYDVAAVQKVNVTLYQEILNALDGGLVLPHNARQFLGGDTAAGGTGQAA
jgi:hypothetical protein